MSIVNILLIVSGGVAGLLIGLYFVGRKKFDEEKATQKADRIFTDANDEASKIRDQAREKVVLAAKQFEVEKEEFAAQLERIGKMLEAKTNVYLRREAKNSEFEKTLKTQEENLARMRWQTGQSEKKIEEKLLQITALSIPQVKEQLLLDYERIFRHDAEIRIQQVVEWTNECAAREARNTVAEAIYRFGEETSVEHAQSKIIVPRDEIKGRIVAAAAAVSPILKNCLGLM